MLDKSVLEKLASVDSPTIANVIELFDIRAKVAGYTNETIKAVYPDLAPVVGFAVTATFRAGYSTERRPYGNVGGIVTAAEELDGPGIAVIQDLDDPLRAAVYGEVMVSCFMKAGIQALVTNGAGRDYLQVKPLKFPCFTSSMIVSHGYANIQDIGIPVQIGGLDVKTGDLLSADGNGIVEIPVDLAEHVAELIDPFMDSEQVVIDSARDSGTSAEVTMKEANAHFARTGKLREDAQKRMG